MKHTTKKINRQIMLSLYILMVLTGIVALAISRNPSIRSTVPQLVTLLASAIFLVIILRKGLSNVLHIVSIAFYIIITISMWMFLGSGHYLGMIHFLLLILIIIETMNHKFQRLFITFFILTYIIFGLIDVFVRNDSSNPNILTLPGFIGASALVVGVAVIVLISRLFKDELLNHLKEISKMDALTGIKNTRAFYEEVELAESDYLRYQTNFTLTYVDVDDFKDINDGYGHFIGDEVLKSLSQFIKLSIRKTDEIYRLGGDEFVVIFKHMSKEQVQKKMEKIEEEYSKQNQIPLGISFGIIERKGLDLSISELLREADKLMYRDKAKKENK